MPTLLGVGASGKWSPRARAAAAAALAVGLTGAGVAAWAWGLADRSPGFEQFVPEPGPARAAVAAALEAWRAGRPVEEGVGPRRDVFVVDKQRRPGQRLVAFEILGEVAAERGRAFAVRLTLDDPAERPLVRFLAVGVNPLWVFRQEDFDMISHWMHPMDEPKAPPAPQP